MISDIYWYVNHTPLLRMFMRTKSKAGGECLIYMLTYNIQDMITAYKTVKGTTCTNCSKMFDSQLLGTVARRTRGAVLDEKTKLEWGAFHEHCEE